MQALREIATIAEMTVAVSGQPQIEDITSTINHAVCSAVKSVEANMLDSLMTRMDTTLSAMNRPDRRPDHRPEQHRVKFNNEQNHHFNSTNSKNCGYCGENNDVVTLSRLTLKKGLAKIRKAITIPKRSQTLISVAVSHQTHDSTVLLEPLKSLAHKHRILAAKALVKIKHGKAYLSLLNPTDRKVRIKARTKLAEVAHVNTETIQNFNETDPSVSSIKTPNSKSCSDLKFDLSESDLTDIEKQKMQKFLNENKQSFATDMTELGKTPLHKHKIVTVPDARPVRRNPYRQSPQVRRETENQIMELLKNQILIGQKDDEGREYVVAYGGKALSGPEKSYHTSEKECLAILRGVEAYRPYLAYSHFTVVTDHSALTWLKSAKLSSRLERWALKLQDLNYDIIHRPGKSNVVADCLSRRPYIEAPTIQSVSTAYPTADSRLESDTDLDTDRAFISGSDELPDGWRTVTEFIYDDETTDSCPIISAIDIEELPQAIDNPDSLFKKQQNCPDFANIITYLQNNTLPQDEKLHRVIVAESGGHLGQDKVYSSLLEKYYWPKMLSDVLQYIKACDRCQRAKRNYNPNNQPLSPMPHVGRFHRWHIDILGPLSKTKDGYEHILLVVDSFTRWTEGFPMKTQTAKEVANILCSEVFSRKSPSCNTTGYSPFYMMFGEEMRLPFDVALEPKDNLSRDLKDYIAGFLENLKIAHTIAKERDQQQKAKDKERHDLKSNIPNFSVGDQVLLTNNKVPKGLSRKLHDKANGPYRIIELGPNYTYKIKHIENNTVHKSLINATNMRRYYDPIIHRQRYINPQDQIENDEGLNQNEHDLQPPQIDNEVEYEQVRNQVENEDTEQIAIKPNKDPPNSQVDNHSNQNRNEKFGFQQIKRGVFRNGQRLMRVEWQDGTRTWEPNSSFDQYLLHEINLKYTQRGKKTQFWAWSASFGMMVIFCGVSVGAMTTKETDIIQRINYGVIFKEEAKMYLAKESWLHTFKVSLPEHFSLPNISFCYENSTQCNYFNSIISFVRHLQDTTKIHLVESIKNVKTLIPQNDILLIKRNARSFLPFIGSLAKGLFGTATMGDVNLLASHINEINKRTRLMARALEQHGDHLSSFMSLVDKRTTNLIDGIKKNSVEILAIANKFQMSLENTQSFFLNTTTLLTELTNKGNMQQKQSGPVSGSSSKFGRRADLTILIAKTYFNTSSAQNPNYLNKFIFWILLNTTSPVLLLY
ncbi:unnamed protein product [Mytilus coruscus]|uniref:Integrase catalytic domain-containing protein n=1 Tax=Mytilus coruscus TaxID=42192 RepID=A0A6J8ALL4_MYTCO|nr:unnamed protein product [Mytilus coruscus]